MSNCQVSFRLYRMESDIDLHILHYIVAVTCLLLKAQTTALVNFSIFKNISQVKHNQIAQLVLDKPVSL